MCPQVSLKFIGTGETFPAEDPIADKGSFAGVPSEMGLKVGGFTVDFIAIGVVTNVHLKKEKFNIRKDSRGIFRYLLPFLIVVTFSTRSPPPNNSDTGI